MQHYTKEENLERKMIADKIAQVKEISVAEVMEKTTAAAKKVYQLES